MTTVVSLPSTSSLWTEPLATALACSHIAVQLAVAPPKSVLIMCGSGISTSCGLQDFRSMGKGRYRVGEREGNGKEPAKDQLPTPSSSFDGSVAREALNLSPSMTKRMFSYETLSTHHLRSLHLRYLATLHRQTLELNPSPTHKFFTFLNNRKKLLRIYSMNIDSLELNKRIRRVPLETLDVEEDDGADSWSNELVQLHGSLGLVRCSSEACGWIGSWEDDHTNAFERGETLECPRCEERAQVRVAKNKRSTPSRTYVRPHITLYNEPASNNEADVIAQLATSDLSSLSKLYLPAPTSSLLPIQPFSSPMKHLTKRSSQSRPPSTYSDGGVLLVLGTSLTIPGFKDLVKRFSVEVKRGGGVCVMINDEDVCKSREWDEVFDYVVLAKCDDFVARIKEEWEAIAPYQIERAAKRRKKGTSEEN